MNTRRAIYRWANWAVVMIGFSIIPDPNDAQQAMAKFAMCFSAIVYAWLEFIHIEYETDPRRPK